MVEFDVTWKNPTEAQNVALKLAMKQKVSGLTEFDVAEMMLMAEESFWFSCLKGWVENPPPLIGPEQAVWRLGCRVILEQVQAGYDPKRMVWWMPKDWNEKTAISKTLSIMFFGLLYHEVHSRSDSCMPASMFAVFDLLLGKAWEKRAKTLLQNARIKQVKKDASSDNPG